MKPEVEPQHFANQSLTHFLEKYYPPEKDKIGKNLPQILIFDQFEEIFAARIKDYGIQQEEFFKQIVEALAQNSSLGVVFIIREEYIARLQPFAAIFPERLRYRFRLERLKEANALAAVRGPLQELNIYDQGLEHEINDIVRNLEDDDKYVEPIHLQVVCQRWWRQRTSDNKNKANFIHEIADVDEALEEFYVNTIRDTARVSNTSENNIRDWCEGELITSSDTRGIVHQSSQTTAGMSNNVVEILDKKYLIRPEIRSGERWYELTHDRLVKPIKHSNTIWRNDQRIKKSRRNKLILIPSAGAIASVAAITLFLIFGPHPIPEPIPLGENPSHISVNAETNRVYVANSGNNTVSVIDGEKNKIIDNIDLPQRPSYVSVNPHTNTIYVSNSANNTVSVIDGTTNQLKEGNITLDGVAIRQTPSFFYVNPQTNIIYVAAYNSTFKSGSITVMNGTTNKVIGKNIPMPEEPTHLAANPKTNMIYVTSYDYSSGASVTAINGTTNNVVAENIPIPEEPTEIAVNPKTNMIYVMAGDTYSKYGSITAIDGEKNEMVTSIKLETVPLSLSIMQDADMIYVTGYNETSQVESVTAING